MNSRGLGFATRWIPMDEVNRAGHLFAEQQGNRGKKLLLIGHLDTVFERTSPFQRFQRQGTTAKGPGVEDMKGGNVVMLYALKALHSIGGLRDAGIIVALIGDEENTGDPISVSRRDLLEAAHRSDVALAFEGAVGGMGSATVARRGSSDWVLQVTSRPGHSSQIFAEDFGSGAINEAARILNSFYENCAKRSTSRSVPASSSAAPLSSMTRSTAEEPPSGKAMLSRNSSGVGRSSLHFPRATGSGQDKDARNRLAKSAPSWGENHVPRFLSGHESDPRQLPLTGSARCAKSGPRSGSSRARGSAGAGSGGHFLRVTSCGSLSRRPRCGRIRGHTVDETVDLDSLPPSIIRAAVLIYRLTREP